MRGYLESVKPKLVKKPKQGSVDMDYHNSFKNEAIVTNNQISKYYYKN